MIVPLGILLVVWLIPADLMVAFREQAAVASGRPRSVAGAVAIVLIWIAAAALVVWWLWPSSAS